MGAYTVAPADRQGHLGRGLTTAPKRPRAADRRRTVLAGRPGRPQGPLTIQPSHWMQPGDVATMGVADWGMLLVRPVRDVSVPASWKQNGQNAR